MSAFYDQIDEILGAPDDLSVIVATVRKCWLYDFKDDPLRLWDGQGNFIDSDGNEWLGTVDGNGTNHHKSPALQDGRDGTSASYNFTFQIPTIPGQSSLELYNALKAEQDKAFARKLTCYIVLFIPGEGLRPGTPVSFYKEMTMSSPKFDEQLGRVSSGAIVKTYAASITGKDGNSGRADVPGRSYADTMQKRRAAELGVSLDRGCEYLALLANRTYQIP